MKSKKHLSFTSLRKAFSSYLEQIPDSRQSGKITYPIHNAVMSGFACMFFQDPSLLHFQQQLKEKQNMDNLETIFGIKDIPEATQLRDIVDKVPSNHLQPIFTNLFSRLQRAKYLKNFQLFDNLYLCSLDATGFFSSENIHCENCLTTHRNNQTSYSHKALQAAIMHPHQKQVIPLMPEEIANTDGQHKQDCEINAAKRIIPKIKSQHPQLGIIIVADGLYSKEPFVKHLNKHCMHYILVAKPKDHISMMNVIQLSDTVEQLRTCDSKGRTHVYEWIQQVPLSGNSLTTPFVNYFHYKIISTDKKGNEKIHYKNSWVTDLDITQENIQTLVRGARCRWKIENECFNTLKNQGYTIEHNFGHGQNYLCFNFYLLTLLAFFFHQIFELTDPLYQACREKFGSKVHLWQSLRSYIKIIIFESFEHLLAFSLHPPETKAPPIEKLLVQ